MATIDSWNLKMKPHVNWDIPILNLHSYYPFYKFTRFKFYQFLALFS